MSKVHLIRSKRREMEIQNIWTRLFENCSPVNGHKTIEAIRKFECGYVFWFGKLIRLRLQPVFQACGVAGQIKLDQIKLDHAELFTLLLVGHLPQMAMYAVLPAKAEIQWPNSFSLSHESSQALR